ncbi:unnamed protein product, partial [Cyprideis torosa]
MIFRYFTGGSDAIPRPPTNLNKLKLAGRVGVLSSQLLPAFNAWAQLEFNEAIDIRVVVSHRHPLSLRTAKLGGQGLFSKNVLYSVLLSNVLSLLIGATV